MSRRRKACDISQKVKKIVFERDGGRCVICGNRYNVMPNAHFVSRANGGLGIPENIFTACTRLTEGDCHNRFDHGPDRAELRERVKQYFRSCYPDWDEERLVYRK